MVPRSAIAITEIALLRPSEVRVVPSIGSTAMSHGRAAGADLLAVEQHGRFVLLALADDDDALHRHGVEDDAHRVDRRAVGAVLVALAEPAAGGQRRRLGDADELEREVPIGGLGLRFHPGERTLQAMDERLLDAARAAVGFMPDDEGLALHDAGREAAAHGPLLEIGTYCGKSAIYLGAAAREAGSVLYTVDHHRGSEENQAGWDHHDERLVDPRSGRMDTLPFFRRTIEEAGLEDVVVAVIGQSPTVAAHWATPLGLVFVDGGHAFDVALADYEGWSRFVAPGGYLVFHDVFEDPAEGGQAPFRVWQRAVADGFDTRLHDRITPGVAPREATGVEVGEIVAHFDAGTLRSGGSALLRSRRRRRAARRR